MRWGGNRGWLRGLQAKREVAWAETEDVGTGASTPESLLLYLLNRQP